MKSFSKYFFLASTLVLIMSYSATALATIFPDVPADHPHGEAINYLKNNNVISGYPDGSFKPESNVNRAELLKILVKPLIPEDINMQNCFPDVHDEWFSSYVCYAQRNGWISGYPDGTFKPSDPVKKVEAIKMIVNINQLIWEDNNFSNDASRFLDIDNNAWYFPFLRIADNRGLLDSFENLYSPASFISRGEVSENMYRALYIKEHSLTNFYDKGGLTTSPTPKTPTPIKES